MKAKCSLFKNSYSPECEHEVSILQILNAIRDGRWESLISKIRTCETKKDRGELKRFLPAVTFSGTFSNSRAEKNIKEYSQLMVIDIDNVKQTEMKRFKNSLTEDPFIVSFFESPSLGLKALVMVNSTVDNHKKTAFPYVQEYFKDMHGITIDKSGKDVCRLCYVSYDPELYYTEDFITFDIPPDFVSVEEKNKQRHFQSLIDEGFLDQSDDALHVFDTCKRWVANSSIGMYHTGNRNNFIHALACFLNRAGMMEDTAITMIATTYQSLELKEIQQAVGSAYKHHKHEWNTKPVFVKKNNQSKMF